MSRDPKLEPLLQEIRRLLRSDNVDEVQQALDMWTEKSNNFEVFLDLLEGVVTTPLRKIYKKKLRNNDDWWHENFAHNPDGFFKLFNESFKHKFIILSWIVETLEAYGAIDQEFVSFGAGELLKLKQSRKTSDAPSNHSSNESEEPTFVEPTLDDNAYYLYGSLYGKRPTSRDEVLDFLRQKARQPVKITEHKNLQLFKGDGTPASVRISKLHKGVLDISFERYCPYEWTWQTASQFDYGEERLLIKGDFLFLERTSGVDTLLGKPTPKIAIEFSETTGCYLILETDPLKTVSTDEICRQQKVAIKVSKIGFAIPQVGVRISFTDRDLEHNNRWLFSRVGDSKKAFEHLKRTTWLDDWNHLKEILPTLDANLRARIVDSFYENLSEEEQAIAINLL